MISSYSWSPTILSLINCHFQFSVFNVVSWPYASYKSFVVNAMYFPSPANSSSYLFTSWTAHCWVSSQFEVKMNQMSERRTLLFFLNSFSSWISIYNDGEENWQSLQISNYKLHDCNVLLWETFYKQYSEMNF